MLKLLLFSSLIFGVHTFAQITITKADFVVGGDTVGYTSAAITGVDFQTTGPNSTWDYSQLVPQTPDNYYFLPPSAINGLAMLHFGTFAATKYKASYFMESSALPIAQVAQLISLPIETLYEYTRITNDSLTAVGYSFLVNGLQIAFKADTIEKKYKFPFTYQSSWTGRGYSDIDLNPAFDAIWRQKKQRASIVDGWGTLTTPYGTYPAVRVRHEIKEQDSIRLTVPIIGQTWVPISLPTKYEYEFWTNNQKIPVLKITTNKVGNNEVVSAVEYKSDVVLGLNDLGMNSINVYPNPTQNILHIDGYPTNAQFKIIDLSGHEVMQINAVGVQHHQVDVSALAGGTYILIVSSDDQQENHIFVKE